MVIIGGHPSEATGKFIAWCFRRSGPFLVLGSLHFDVTDKRTVDDVIDATQLVGFCSDTLEMGVGGIPWVLQCTMLMDGFYRVLSW